MTRATPTRSFILPVLVAALGLGFGSAAAAPPTKTKQKQHHKSPASKKKAPKKKLPKVMLFDNKLTAKAVQAPIPSLSNAEFTFTIPVRLNNIHSEGMTPENQPKIHCNLYTETVEWRAEKYAALEANWTLAGFNEYSATHAGHAAKDIPIKANGSFVGNVKVAMDTSDKWDPAHVVSWTCHLSFGNGLPQEGPQSRIWLSAVEGSLVLSHKANL